MVLTALLYISDATDQVDLNDLLAIQQESLEFNPRFNITGILFHFKGQFVQLLEGDSDTVLQLFIKIVQDDRHQNVRLLYHRRVDDRIFSDWHMAMLDLELHGNAQRLDIQDLIFYAKQLETDPTARQQIDNILARFRSLMLTGYEE